MGIQVLSQIFTHSSPSVAIIYTGKSPILGKEKIVLHVGTLALEGYDGGGVGACMCVCVRVSEWM